MQKTSLRKRDLYLNRIIAFQDTEMIKVMTGIRRCGKSSLMKLMAEHLRETGVTDDQIIEMNFESMGIPDMDARGFYEYVKARICPNKRTYLFFDEVQKVHGWEIALNSFRVDFDCDIYISQDPMPICFLLSFPLIYPDDMWKLKYGRYHLRNFWTFMAIS